MSRKKERTVTRVHFNLSSANVDHERLRAHLDALAEDGEASAWIRRTLIAALPSPLAGHSSHPARSLGLVKDYPAAPSSDGSDVTDEPRYVNEDES